MNISLKTIFSKYKFPIFVTFLLLSFESIALALMPFVMGLAINSLLENQYSGIYYLIFLLFIIVFISTARRLYDTRVYAKIYALLGVKLIKNHKKSSVETSTIVTRSSLIKELVDFFEHDLTQAYSSIIGVVAAFVMMMYLNLYASLLSLLVLVFVVLVYYLSRNKIFDENSKLNNHLENRLNTINQKNIFLVPHFKKVANAMIKLSDIESYNFLIIQTLVSAFIVATLFISVSYNVQAGSIFSIMSYALNFSMEMFMLPMIYGQFIRLREITQRINDIKE